MSIRRGNNIIAGRAGVSVYEDTASTSVTLPEVYPGSVYKYGTLTSLTINKIQNSPYETVVIFTSGTAKPTINLPDTLETINFVEFEAGKKYVIAISNNIAVMGNVD